jgi:hypothetical protein
MNRTIWWCCAARITAHCTAVGCGSTERFRPGCGSATPTALLTVRCRRRCWWRPAKGRSPGCGVSVSRRRPRGLASNRRYRALRRMPRQRRCCARPSRAPAAARSTDSPLAQTRPSSCLSITKLFRARRKAACGAHRNRVRRDIACVIRKCDGSLDAHGLFTGKSFGTGAQASRSSKRTISSITAKARADARARALSADSLPPTGSQASA